MTEDDKISSNLFTNLTKHINWCTEEMNSCLKILEDPYATDIEIWKASGKMEIFMQLFKTLSDND